MGPLFLIFSLLLAPTAVAQLPKEFRLSQKETESVLVILNQTYTKLKQLPSDRTKSSNANSIDTKEVLFGGRQSYLTVDSCSEENGSSLCFVVSVFTQRRYPQDIVYFTYDPATKTGLLCMFRIDSPYQQGRVYETSEEKVKSKFKDLLARINEFL